MKIGIFGIICLIILNSCSGLRPSPKNSFIDAYYIQKTDQKRQKVYVDVEEEILRIHPTTVVNGEISIDNSKTTENYPERVKNVTDKIIDFSKHSLDFDFLTIPLKYRFSQYDVPHQLNANLNGAVYLGYRTDKYAVSYKPTPLKESVRNITHYGFSMGLFTGLGNTFMSPTNTYNSISQEYDGIVWNKGVAGIFAVNNFTVGLSLGVDHLLDSNRNVWIYQTKPWLGIAFGLNLN